MEWLVIGLMLGATPAVEAASRCEQLLGEVSDDPELHAQLHAALAALAAMQGRFDEARASLERSKEMMAGLSEWIWIVAIWWGFVFLWQDDVERAEARAPAGVRGARVDRGEEPLLLDHALHVRRRLRARRPRRGGAADHRMRARRAAPTTSTPTSSFARSGRRCFAHTGRIEEAKVLAREAVALAETGDFLLAHADAVADLGVVLELAGEQDDSGGRARGSRGAVRGQRGNRRGRTCPSEHGAAQRGLIVASAR